MNVKLGGARPWRMFLPLGVMLLLSALWSGYWVIAVSLIKDRVQSQRQSLAERGTELLCATESWGGFPFRFAFTCMVPVFRVNDTLLQAQQLDVIAQAYNPWHILALVKGPTEVTSPSRLALSISHSSARASIRFRSEPEPEVSVEIPNLDAAGCLTAKKMLVHLRPEPGSSHGIALSAAAFNFQPDGRPPLPLDSIQFVGTLSPALELGVKALELSQGAVIYKGAGTIGLDSQRRISGQLNTETNDLDGLLAILNPHVAMTEQQWRGVTAMLRLLGQNARADIIARNGELFIGPFKVADLAPLY